uniref:Cystatin domain-containing protein n=1 Tax=Davidia involucrata TaxID=16924 RepID=A0A5B6Z2Q7_DAVIN
MTKKDWLSENYDDTMTNGFDVEDFSNTRALSLITPLANPEEDLLLIKDLNKWSDFSIKDYNVKHNANYEFVKVVNANSLFVQGVYFYITFEAKDAVHSQSKIFQAKVFEGYGLCPSEFEFCRIKPTTQSR